MFGGSHDFCIVSNDECLEHVRGDLADAQVFAALLAAPQMYFLRQRRRPRRRTTADDDDGSLSADDGASVDGGELHGFKYEELHAKVRSITFTRLLPKQLWL